MATDTPTFDEVLASFINKNGSRSATPKPVPFAQLPKREKHRLHKLTESVLVAAGFGAQPTA
jgi:hypothetical protein